MGDRVMEKSCIFLLRISVCKFVHVKMNALCVSSYVSIVKCWRPTVCFYGYNKPEKNIWHASFLTVYKDHVISNVSSPVKKNCVPLCVGVCHRQKECLWAQLDHLHCGCDSSCCRGYFLMGFRFNFLVASPSGNQIVSVSLYPSTGHRKHMIWAIK